MKKHTLHFTILLLLSLLVFVLPASATEPTVVSGEYTFSYGPPVMREAGNNCFIEVDGTYPFTGDLVGTATTHFWAISHGPCATAYPFANKETLYGLGTFDGTVLGHSGTFDFVYTGRGWPADPGEVALDARFVILSGTGDLENLHGLFAASYVMGDAYDTYTGQVHFDPDGS